MPFSVSAVTALVNAFSIILWNCFKLAPKKPSKIDCCLIWNYRRPMSKLATKSLPHCHSTFVFLYWETSFIFLSWCFFRLLCFGNSYGIVVVGNLSIRRLWFKMLWFKRLWLSVFEWFLLILIGVGLCVVLLIWGLWKMFCWNALEFCWYWVGLSYG